MKSAAKEVIEQRAIDIFESENPSDVHWRSEARRRDPGIDSKTPLIISEEDREKYRRRAEEQLKREYLGDEDAQGAERRETPS